MLFRTRKRTPHAPLSRSMISKALDEHLPFMDRPGRPIDATDDQEMERHSLVSGILYLAGVTTSNSSHSSMLWEKPCVIIFPRRRPGILVDL